MESQFFIFDGVKSSDMGLQIMRIDHSGFIETPYASSVDIKEERMNKRFSPCFYGVERDNIEFTVQMVLVDKYGQSKKWTPQERYKIARWLFHNEYKPFQTSDDMGKYYYVIAINDANLNLMHTEGYIEITFRNNSPFAWSPIYIEKFNLTNNTNNTIIEFENKSNILKKYYPKIELEYPSLQGFTGSTNITLKNLSNGGKEFKITDIKKGEIYSFDNGNKIIKSSRQTNLNPLKHFNRNWLDLVYGVNQISVQGKCNIWVKSQYPILQ